MKEQLWLEVGSIPRNGTWVLIWDEDYKKCVIARCGQSGIPESGDWDYSHICATHWMPLPGSPNEDNPHNTIPIEGENEI